MALFIFPFFFFFFFYCRTTREQRLRTSNHTQTEAQPTFFVWFCLCFYMQIQGQFSVFILSPKLSHTRFKYYNKVREFISQPTPPHPSPSPFSIR